MNTEQMTLDQLFEVHDHHTELFDSIAAMLVDWGDPGDPNMPRQRLIDPEDAQPIFVELRRLSSELAKVGAELTARAKRCERAEAA